MSASVTNPGTFVAHDSFPAVERGRLGVWLFLVTEAMFFAGLIAAFLALRSGSAQWPVTSGRLEFAPAAVATALLVASSCTMALAIRAIRLGSQRGLVAFLGLTLALGLSFLGIQALEWGSLFANGIGPRSDLFWSCFFVLTGVHGLHVLAGATWILVTALFSRRFTRAAHAPVELAGLYWHFVDGVWIVLFTLLYLA